MTKTSYFLNKSVSKDLIILKESPICDTVLIFSPGDERIDLFSTIRINETSLSHITDL